MQNDWPGRDGDIHRGGDRKKDELNYNGEKIL